MPLENATNIGEILYQERARKNISQEQIFEGVYSQSRTSKLENGSCIPDKLLTDVSLQRLGRCSDTLEAIMSLKEYTMFDIRETLKRHFYSEDYPRDKALLQEYRQWEIADKPIHAQFFGIYHALNEYRVHKDIIKCRNELETALEITFPQWRTLDFAQYSLCGQKLHLMILIAFFILEDKDIKEDETLAYIPKDQHNAVRMLNQTADYLEQYYCEEEKAKYFPQCMWLLAAYWKQQSKWDKVEEYAVRGLECAAKSSALPLLAKLLELVIESRDFLLGQWEERHAVCCELNSLKEVLTCYGSWVLSLNNLALLQFLCHEDDVSLDFEILRDIRKNCGVPQDKIKSCTQTTISRIECAKQRPFPANFIAITKELGVDKHYYGSRVMSNNYDLYELAHQRNQASFNQEWKKEAELLNQLEASLDMTIPINKQYIETCRLEEKKHRGEIEPEEGIRQLEEILRYTMSDYREGKLRVPSRHEFVILNMLAGFMRKSGRIEEALKLRERILQVFEKSHVKEEYHTNSMLLLYKSYGGLLEDMGKLQLAEEMDIRGIHLAIQCGQGDIIGKILANLACVYQKMDSPEKQLQSKECFRNAYWLCCLMKQPKLAQKIKKYYKSIFGEDVSV